jgi:hypothetical protein
VIAAANLKQFILDLLYERGVILSSGRRAGINIPPRLARIASASFARLARGHIERSQGTLDTAQCGPRAAFGAQCARLAAAPR